MYALENGTQGWFLSNLNLENNKTNYLKIEPKKNEIEKKKNKITNLLNKNHIQVINLSKVQDLIEDKTRSTYIFNVKTNLSSNISIHGIRNVPGGQLVQATDNYVGVLKSRIILFDEGDLVRAGTTALWLKKMNFECYVFNGIETEINNLNIEIDKLKIMIEESNSLYESVLDKTTKSLQDIISNTDLKSELQ